MPEYLAPGVYMEEVSYRSKSIEGVSTTTTGFIGPARFGPLNIEPELVTSLVEYDRVYGDQQKLQFSDGEVDNWLRHAVRAFFEEGGKRLYVSRVYHPDPTGAGKHVGHAAWAPSPPIAAFEALARFPGVAGDARVTVRLDLSRNRFAELASGNTVRGALDRDVVYVKDSGIDGTFLLRWNLTTREWVLLTAGVSNLASGTRIADLTSAASVQALTATVTLEPAARTMPVFVLADLALDPRHARSGTPDSIFAQFGPHDLPAQGGGGGARTIVGPLPSRARNIPLLLITKEDTDGLEVLQAFVDLYTPETSAQSPPNPDNGLLANLLIPESDARRRSVSFDLVGGSDGAASQPGDYEGAIDPYDNTKTGLRQFEDLEDISIVAAPGATADGGTTASAVTGLLISHAERMRYRIAVLEAPRGATISEVRNFRASFDSTHAALYYPWVTISDPLTGLPGNAPPAGFVAGIYARNDVNRAVYKAPANEVINLAIGFEKTINTAQQESLNPEGINCLRFFEGRGYRVWGARTISSDPEWKYVNLRRYFAYLERSIERGTQWAVFEPNGERLWAKVKQTIESFLLSEWTNGALLGERTEKAYFVKCDRSTMTQNDLDNGRLICLIGVAALRPAEFVIFRIGQWTADRRN